MDQTTSNSGSHRRSRIFDLLDTVSCSILKRGDSKSTMLEKWGQMPHVLTTCKSSNQIKSNQIYGRDGYQSFVRELDSTCDSRSQVWIPTMTLPGYFWDRWPYFAGKLCWDITTTQVNSALHPSGVAKSSTSFGWGKGGSHLCRVAGNTVWSHMACDFP